LRIGDLILSANAVRLRVLVHLPAIGGAIRENEQHKAAFQELGAGPHCQVLLAFDGDLDVSGPC
jgi:hypothetical protein